MVVAMRGGDGRVMPLRLVIKMMAAAVGRCLMMRLMWMRMRLMAR